jgi:hypothetical protein
MSFQIEKDWITDAGFRAVVTMGDLGHRCGYVGLPSSHPLFGADYGDEIECLADLPEGEPIGKRGIIPLLCAAAEGRIPRSPEMTFDVHGGLTYAGGKDDYPVNSDLWWFGYDCGHSGDKPSPEYCQRMRKEFPDKPYMWRDHDGIHRSLDYCVAECESLARQIQERTVSS